jgi:hypothetical protein
MSEQPGTLADIDGYIDGAFLVHLERAGAAAPTSVRRGSR